MLVEEIEIFCKGVEESQKNGLLYEFVESFFQDYNLSNGLSIPQSVGFALYEWDMI
jgi:hypothetical protein